jgi:hypothetical protein
MRLTARLLLGLAFVGASQALGQGGANVTVQLPNITTFGVNTSVLVPDSGPSPLARHRQAQYSRAMYGGFPRQRAFGAQTNVGMAGVTAQIHDQRATDDAILRAARARRTNWVRGGTASSLGSLTTDGRLLESVADIERRRAFEQADDNQQAEALVEKAGLAHRSGKTGVALIYLEMAARQASGQLKGRIESEAAQLKRDLAVRRAARGGQAP